MRKIGAADAAWIEWECRVVFSIDEKGGGKGEHRIESHCIAHVSCAGGLHDDRLAGGWAALPGLR